MKRLMQVLTMLVVSALVVAGAAWAAEIEVTAKKIKDAEAPKIDGKVDKIWDSVRATKAIASEGPQGKVEINLKVLYTDKEIFFLFQWPDKTESLNRFFEFDGKEWKKFKGNEDRLNLAWDIDNTVKDFPKKGCAAVCHKVDKEVELKTNAADERVDIWHWKAQRSNPAGYADDKWLGHEAKKIIYEGREIARYRGNDAATSGAGKGNWDKEAKRPKYTFKEGVSAGPILHEKDAVEIKDFGKFKAGDRLPLETVTRPAGSRSDVDAQGVWKDGRWTLEFRRARATEDKQNDVQFVDPGRPYYFGISVHDNETDDNHSHTGETVLKLILK